ncbi:MAG TPA: Jag N-terminal domain-containing protein [Ktedonosporobacter sp.]|nr:Jag N-terminal domain-containing protein [Ktedonosporobacter sp.]
MESIEASGKSVDEAVQQALARLGKRRDEVEIAVLQEPSRGTFGLGSKDARVRVTVRSGSAGAIITPEMADAILGPGEIEVPLPEEEAYDEEEFEDEDDFEDEDEDEDDFEDEDEDEEGEEFEEELAPFIGSGDLSLPSSADLADVTAASGEMKDVEVPRVRISRLPSMSCSIFCVI